MTRYLVLALVAAGIIAAAGYLVYSRTLDKPEAAAPAPAVAPTPPPPPIKEAQQTKVTAVTGRVERRTDTGWAELKVGDVLSSHDTIRTAEGARATLDAGVVVEVDDRTELTVGEITDSLSELALTEGRITANAGGTGGPTVRVSTRNSDAVAEAEAGSFDVLSSGSGDITVAAREGNVKLTAQQQTVTVGAGQFATASAGKVPSQPAAIPGSLFLKVAANHKAGTSEVRGEAPGGSLVSINGVRSLVPADGRFTTQVPIKRGETQIVVQVEDVLGRRERKVLARKVETPKLDTKVEWQ